MKNDSKSKLTPLNSQKNITSFTSPIQLPPFNSLNSTKSSGSYFGSSSGFISHSRSITSNKSITFSNDIEDIYGRLSGDDWCLAEDKKHSKTTETSEEGFNKVKVKVHTKSRHHSMPIEPLMKKNSKLILQDCDISSSIYNNSSKVSPKNPLNHGKNS